ncbi:MAG: hypothetical protein ACR2KT_04200 [Methylocella sp.]
MQSNDGKRTAAVWALGARILALWAVLGLGLMAQPAAAAPSPM